ncbi:TonB-dependent receptor [Adhaeribacter rhizoryzae]|uniref:TonB-dependent receptor n=1 Tax=Adhaeribacter rhizoryzae TaxID=2607907 RepID=UPI001CC1F632|nr:TonB-dependent receptor [Adhaeribacter rhizoryzae]
MPASNNCGLTLAGKITNQHRDEPLPAATIILEELNQAIQTDMAGNYHFHDLCPGVYHIKTTYVGFDPIRLEVRLAAPAIRNLKLHPNTTELGTVQISGNRVAPPPTQATGIITGEALESTRGESLGRVLEQVAGVTTLNTGPSISKPIIHGLHSNRVLLLNNGVRQEGQQWGAEHAPEIDPNIVSTLTVVKGAAGVRFGSDAIGGVVLVEPAPLRDSVGTDATINLVGRSNSRMGNMGATVNHNSAKLPALSWRLQGTLKKGGNAKTPDYYLKNTGFSEHNFSATIGYRQGRYGLELYYSQFNTRLGILSAAHIGNPTDLLRAIESPVPLETSNFSYKINRPYQQVNHDLLKLSGYIRTGEAGRLTWVSSFQDNKRAEYDKHLPRNNELAALNRPELSLQLQTFSNELAWEHRPYKNITGTIGLSGMVQRNQYQGRFFIPNYYNYTSGLFWLERWRKAKWQLEAGTRYDYRLLDVVLYEKNIRTEPQFTYHNFSGTLGGIYELNHYVTFSLNAGTAFRAPSANELFSRGRHHATIEIGDRNLKSENAYKLVATATYRSEKKLNGELSFYHSYIRNYIFLEPVFPPELTVAGTFLAFRHTQTNATFKGADLSLSYGFTDAFSAQVKASLVWAYNFKKDDYLIFTPANRLDAHLRYEPVQAKGTFLQVGGLLVARQNRVPADLEPNLTPGEDAATLFMPKNGDFIPPPPGYFLLQASLGTTINIKNQPVEISFTGHNLLNQSYREYLNRFRYFADEMGRNVVLRVRVPLNFNSK